MEASSNFSNSVNHAVLLLLPRAVATRESRHSRARQNSPVSLASNALCQRDDRVSVYFQCRRI